MSARSKGRKRALDLLFAADVRQEPLSALIEAAQTRAEAEPERKASWDFARLILDGILEHAEEVDDIIEAHANGWPLHRMPAVDRAVLRLATWELRYNEQVPDAAAISEAVKLAGELSTDDSARFVNGVLSAVSASGDGDQEADMMDSSNQ